MSQVITTESVDVDVAEPVDLGVIQPTSVAPPPAHRNRMRTAPLPTNSPVIGTSMIPPQNSSFGLTQFSFPNSAELNWPIPATTSISFDQKGHLQATTKPVTQQVTSRINGAFYVYHEKVGGTEDYLVVYMEDGLLSVNQLVENSSKARGFYQVEFQNNVIPTDVTTGQPLVNGVNWISSSPSTVNQSTNHQDMVVDTFSQEISSTVNKDGGSTTVSETQSVQLWNSDTRTITDWGVNEVSDGSTNKAAWVWHQQEVWDPLVQDTQSFKDWYKQIYETKGEAVRVMPQLSISTLQYHCTAAWRFNCGLVNARNQLLVSFRGGHSRKFAATAIPGYGGNKHHMLYRRGISYGWTWQFDLVDLVNKGAHS